jgi:hypothetical protein
MTRPGPRILDRHRREGPKVDRPGKIRIPQWGNAPRRGPTSTAASTIGVGGVDGNRAGRAIAGRRDPQ